MFILFDAVLLTNVVVSFIHDLRRVLPLFDVGLCSRVLAPKVFQFTEVSVLLFSLKFGITRLSRIIILEILLSILFAILNILIVPIFLTVFSLFSFIIPLFIKYSTIIGTIQFPFSGNTNFFPRLTNFFGDGKTATIVAVIRLLSLHSPCDLVLVVCSAALHTLDPSHETF